jgi:hypothetical protein
MANIFGKYYATKWTTARSTLPSNVSLLLQHNSVAMSIDMAYIDACVVCIDI